LCRRDGLAGRYLVGLPGADEEIASARFHSELDEVAADGGPVIDLRATAAHIRRRLRGLLLDLDVDFRTHGPLAGRPIRASLRSDA
jgi:hypothetical protein